MEAYHGNTTQLFALLKRDAPLALKWMLAVFVLLWIRDRLTDGTKQIYTAFLVLALIAAVVSKNGLPNITSALSNLKQTTGL